jgi:predicted DNA-binding mobile mystery protein A
MKIRTRQIQLLNQILEQKEYKNRPSSGWIKAIRTSLGMSSIQLGKRLGLNPIGILRMESRELTDDITLKSLRKIADAMECQLIYGFVPKSGTLNSIIEKQAKKKAHEIIKKVHHTMALENQAVDTFDEDEQELIEDLMEKPCRRLWS